MIILSTCSARPNFVKLAAVHHAIEAAKKNGADITHVIVHTGQHYDPLLSDIFFTQLQIPPPDHNLGMKGGNDRENVIEETMNASLPILKKEKPDIVLVYGDVNGALGAARAAKKLHIKLGHVEAGLRSFDQSMPEELNRKDIDHLADSLFVTEQSGMENLAKEKAPGQAILVGNTMIDTLIRMTPYIEKEKIPEGIPESFVLVTLHRPSNVDDPAVLAANLAFITEVSEHCPVVLPLHPRAKATIDAFQLRPMIGPDVHITDPFGYLQFLALLKKSRCILTDSGGIQEEATFLKKKCFTLRPNTERPSTVESGSNTLISPDIPADRAAAIAFTSHPSNLSIVVPPFWDGHAGKRIVATLP